MSAVDSRTTKAGSEHITVDGWLIVVSADRKRVTVRGPGGKAVLFQWNQKSSRHNVVIDAVKP